ncbi:hypothetical protein F2P81_023669 [Scophthalmus maximus]|uniref:Uncharacterized protein n=1 Tax=Scophthalmus maximus TaxID=52904 RepID=A0A6A4RWP9_SCOMX|nr:hypothetical protein F2P81_023669 [Scophthalmus maximus]
MELLVEFTEKGLFYFFYSFFMIVSTVQHDCFVELEKQRTYRSEHYNLAERFIMQFLNVWVGNHMLGHLISRAMKGQPRPFVKTSAVVSFIDTKYCEQAISIEKVPSPFRTCTGCTVFTCEHTVHVREEVKRVGETDSQRANAEHQSTSRYLGEFRSIPRSSRISERRLEKRES